MTASRTVMMRRGALFAALSMSLVPTITCAAQLRHKKLSPPHPISISSGSIGSFTPAAADPRFGSSFGRIGLGDSGFRFTPSSAPGSNTRRVTVAVRARAATAAQAGRAGLVGLPLNAYAYNLGVAVGWRRFAVSTDYSKVDLGIMPGSREAADVALSFAGKRWSTRLALGADRPLGETHVLDAERGVSVDLGGSYSITNRLDVTGGVRYKMEQQDNLQFLNDSRRDAQAIYVGTAFRF